MGRAVGDIVGCVGAIVGERTGSELELGELDGDVVCTEVQQTNRRG